MAHTVIQGSSLCIMSCHKRCNLTTMALLPSGTSHPHIPHHPFTTSHHPTCSTHHLLTLHLLSIILLHTSHLLTCSTYLDDLTCLHPTIMDLHIYRVHLIDPHIHPTMAPPMHIPRISTRGRQYPRANGTSTTIRVIPSHQEGLLRYLLTMNQWEDNETTGKAIGLQSLLHLGRNPITCIMNIMKAIMSLEWTLMKGMITITKTSIKRSPPTRTPIMISHTLSHHQSMKKNTNGLESGRSTLKSSTQKNHTKDMTSLNSRRIIGQLLGAGMSEVALEEESQLAKIHIICR